ncbi:MAG: AAA family ATPase [Pseudomonadota bacterium]
MVKLKWLQIERFRQAAPCRLEFSDGFNVLLGRNGTGKTNLLKLIAMIAKGDFSGLKEEEFAFSYRIESGLEALEVDLRIWFEEHSDQMYDVRPGSSRPIRRFSYILTFVRAESSTVVATDRGPEGRLLVAGKPSSSPAPDPLSPNFLYDLGVVNTTSGPEDLLNLVTFLHVLESPGRFNEALGAFESVLGARDNRETNRVELGPEAFALTIGAPVDEKGGLSLTCRFTPLGIVNYLLLKAEHRAFETIRVDKDGWVYLESWAELLGFESVTLLSTRSQRRLVPTPFPRIEHLFEDLTVHFTLPDGSIINQDQLSFGQKRFLSFLWYLACNEQGVIIADELVNGLHHAWIEHAMHAIPPRQAFLASQNPLLFDFLTFESPEDVRKTFILCDLEDGERRRKWLWHAMEEDTAARFFRAYRAGFQHVSELLRTKGIW